MTRRPYPLLRWLVERIACPEDRPYLLADLDEEYAEVAATHGTRSARRWYRAQCLRSLIPLAAHHLRHRHRVHGVRLAQADGPLHDIQLDVRVALRGLARHPAWALAIVATFALGFGAHTATYSIVHSVLVRALPYPEPERIVRLSELHRDGRLTPGWTSIKNFLDWKAQSATFSALALFRGRSMAVTGEPEAEYVYSSLVTEGFFDVFGGSPLIGRVFDAQDGLSGAPRVVVLGHDLWQRRFEGEAAVLGRDVILNGRPATVVGVMPAAFRAPAEVIGVPDMRIDLWVPLAVEDALGRRDDRSFNPVARLAPGTTLTQARSEMRGIARRLALGYPEANAGFTTEVTTWHESVVGATRSALLLLWSTCAFALLVACGNVAILLLNRALSQEPEMALRAALGAGRIRLARQTILEGLILAGAGGALGLAGASAGLRVFAALAPESVFRLVEWRLDGTALAVGSIFTFLVALTCLLLPARHGSRPRLTRALDGRYATSPRSHAVRLAIVALQIVFSFTLVVAAALMARSFQQLSSMSPGLEPEGVGVVTVALSWDRVSTIEERARWVSSALEAFRAVPGVVSAAMINSLPFSGSNQQMHFRIEGIDAPDADRLAAIRGVSPAYFRTMGIPLRQGRDFDERDLTEPGTVLVNETFLRRFVSDGDALGKRLTLGDGANESVLTVIGVVGDVRHYGLAQTVRPEIYRSYTAEFLTSKSFVVRVRASTPVATILPILVESLRALDPDQPLRDIQSMSDYVDRSIAQTRFAAAVIGSITAIAALLAAVGLFGMLSSLVSERERDIALRLALGAGRKRVLWDVLRRSLTLVSASSAAGLLLSLLVGRALKSLLYGVRSDDPFTLVTTTVLFAAVALGAGYLPARRAASMDPATLLRR